MIIKAVNLPQVNSKADCLLLCFYFILVNTGEIAEYPNIDVMRKSLGKSIEEGLTRDLIINGLILNGYDVVYYSSIDWKEIANFPSAYGYTNEKHKNYEAHKKSAKWLAENTKHISESLRDISKRQLILELKELLNKGHFLLLFLKNNHSIVLFKIKNEIQIYDPNISNIVTNIDFDKLYNYLSYTSIFNKKEILFREIIKITKK